MPKKISGVVYCIGGNPGRAKKELECYVTAESFEVYCFSSARNPLSTHQLTQSSLGVLYDRHTRVSVPVERLRLAGKEGTE